MAPVSDDNPTKAGPDHLVTCATVDEDGGWVQNVPVDRR